MAFAGWPFFFVPNAQGLRGSTTETDMEQPIAPTTETPLTLRQHLDADTASVEQAAAPVVEEAKADTPELEAASTKPDADLSEAARTLRRNRADERKAKIQREIAEHVREREETRADVQRERDALARLRQEREQLSRGPAPRATAGAAPAGITDPNDPQPQEADYQDYSHFVADNARWAAREELRRHSFESRARTERQAADRATQELSSTLDKQHETTREKYADFDAVLEPVLAPLANTPRGMDVARFLASSEVGGEVVYRLGKDAAALKRVTDAPNQPALMRALAHVETEILASRTAPKPTTKAPAPPSQTVGSGASATASDDPNTRTFRDHMRIENAREDEVRRRRLGVR